MIHRSFSARGCQKDSAEWSAAVSDVEFMLDFELKFGTLLFSIHVDTCGLRKYLANSQILVARALYVHLICRGMYIKR